MLMALYTANVYSAECEMSASACTRSRCLDLLQWINLQFFESTVHDLNLGVFEMQL